MQITLSKGIDGMTNHDYLSPTIEKYDVAIQDIRTEIKELVNDKFNKVSKQISRCKWKSMERWRKRR